MTVNFNPSLVVNYATETVSLVRNIDLTYSVSSGEALKIDGPLGVVTIEDPIEDVPVNCFRIADLTSVATTVVSPLL